MKKLIVRFLPAVILLLAVVLSVPGLVNRVKNEERNGTVVLSALYSPAAMKLSPEKMDAYLTGLAEAGIGVVSVMEDNFESLAKLGHITCDTLYTVRGRYDEKSRALSALVAEGCPAAGSESFVMTVHSEEDKARLAEQFADRFDERDYRYLGTFEGDDVYVFLNGNKELWEFAVGYNEDVIKMLTDRGFEVALVHTLKNYGVFAYLDEIDRLVKRYDVEYLNLKADPRDYTEIPLRAENYRGIADILVNNRMTLVLTEHVTQLSNQKFHGYDYVVNAVLNSEEPKIMRSYETTDDSHADATRYQHRVEQFLNSTVDRSLRFITVTQIEIDNVSLDQSADDSLAAAKEYKAKAEALGYTVGGEAAPITYQVNRRLSAALGAVVMVMAVLMMVEAVFGKKCLWLTLGAVALAAAAFGGTFVLPMGLVMLYPSVYSVVQACFAVTAVLWLMKKKGKQWPLAVLAPLATVTAVGCLLLLGTVQGSMLSGIDYYLNNALFRGTKLSLILPILYAAAAYYFMFIYSKDRGLLSDALTALTARIRVYWVVLAGVVAVAGLIYIVRSGNVNSISSIEQMLRSKVTELFTARPRTKEFLIGYPALVLFVYYFNKTDYQPVRWLLAVAMSILASSVSNSFCHVFTNFTITVTRTLNGLVLGVIIAAALYVVNYVGHKLFELIRARSAKEG